MVPLFLVFWCFDEFVYVFVFSFPFSSLFF